MTMITGQLAASDEQKQTYATLADESGIAATLWFGTESVVLQVTSTGQVVLVYNDGHDGDPKAIFMGFMWEIATTRSFAQTEADGSMTLEANQHGD